MFTAFKNRSILHGRVFVMLKENLPDMYRNKNDSFVKETDISGYIVV